MIRFRDLMDGPHHSCDNQAYLTEDPGNICEFCGDGVIAGTEICDDKNQINGDGCSSSCTFETGFNTTICPDN